MKVLIISLVAAIILDFTLKFVPVTPFWFQCLFGVMSWFACENIVKKILD